MNQSPHRPLRWRKWRYRLEATGLELTGAVHAASFTRHASAAWAKLGWIG
jgi:hypothetical protein